MLNPTDILKDYQWHREQTSTHTPHVWVHSPLVAAPAWPHSRLQITQDGSREADALSSPDQAKVGLKVFGITLKDVKLDFSSPLLWEFFLARLNEDALVEFGEYESFVPHLRMHQTG